MELRGFLVELRTDVLDARLQIRLAGFTWLAASTRLTPAAKLGSETAAEEGSGYSENAHGGR